MTNEERKRLLNSLSAIHWQLVGVYPTLDRSMHRLVLSQADHGICSILNELQDELPHLAVDNGEASDG